VEFRAQPWNTRIGTLELTTSKLPTGSDFPSQLEARRHDE